MDWFTQALGPEYVPAFAGRLVLAMGRGIARAPAAMKRAFLEEDLEGMWTLSLVVVRWYAEALPPAEAKVVNEALQAYAMGPYVATLQMVQGALRPFVQRAHQAQNEAQLAAAGVYFVAAVEQIGLGTLSAALHAAPLRALQEQLRVRLPPPAELYTVYGEALGLTQNGTPSVAPAKPGAAARGERFDRADRGGSRPEMAERRSAQRVEAKPSQGTKAAYAAPPAPRLASADVTRAYLHTLGWPDAEVERLIAGPGGTRRA